ncbi:hypothetical protein FZEAL_5416 [Fusarium zealandicum]|uniref:Uncharacterized protein n=1 Tax=Fusarium zealandicum TaxID=1053134 RepID=A0A8H4UKT2_9HYPO|nr:hypothetical protein FZEAL_5416 [Fusarium zealandicum]
MTGPEKNVPVTLRERMNDYMEVFIFQSWFRSYSKDGIGSSTAIQPFYDKNTSSFMERLEDPHLRAAIERYLAEQPMQESWLNCKPDSCSWKQVIEEIQSTKDFYQSRGDKNPIRRCFRKGPGIARNFIPLLESIPQEDGLGLLKGGLLIIFNAVKRRSDTCQRIFDSFEKIPLLIMKAQKLHECYPDDESLFTASASLYHELVKCIPLLIEILLRKSNNSAVKKFTKSVFGDSLADVEMILKQVNVAEARLEQCRQELNTKMTATTGRGLDSLHRDVHQGFQAVNEGVGGLRQDFGGFRQDVKESLEKSLEKLANYHLDASRERDKIGSDLSRTVKECFSVMTQLHSFIQDGKRTLSPHTARYNDQELFNRSRSNRQLLMERICTEDERTAPIRDLGLILRKYHEFSNKALARVQYLVTTPEFQRWLTSTTSEILLVDGHSNDQSIGRIAPTSLMCAGLVESLHDPEHDWGYLSRPPQPQIVLYFFAGQHVSSNNDLAGPHGLISSLIDQLLFQWPDEQLFGTEPSNRYSDIWENIAYPNVHSLCSVFEQLIDQLSASAPVSCIIDGVSYFETSLHGWANDMTYIVECFHDCIERKSWDVGRGFVKFLLVSPDKSTVLGRYISDNYHVDLRAGNMYSPPIRHSNKALEIMEAEYREI